MPVAELIAVAVATARVAPDVWTTIKTWADSGHEPTPEEIAELEARYQVNSDQLRDRIAAAKARTGQG